MGQGVAARFSATLPLPQRIHNCRTATYLGTPKKSATPVARHYFMCKLIFGSGRRGAAPHAEQGARTAEAGPDLPQKLCMEMQE